MKIYETGDFAITDKSDNSPLTKADKAGNAVIVAALKENYPDIPIISEENKMIDYSERKDWEYFWLVDPLTEPKSLLKRMVNLPLILRSFATENQLWELLEFLQKSNVLCR